MPENIHRVPPNSNPTSSPTQVENSAFQGRRTLIITKCISQPTINDSFSDTSSIIVYSPLFPTQTDFVELAELVPYDTVSGEVEEERDLVVNSAEGENRVGTQETPAGRPSWTLMWPFSKWYRSKDQPSLGSVDPHQQSTPSQNNIDDSNPPTTRTVKSQRAWVPSPSKLSLQVFWWAYRMSVNSLHPIPYLIITYPNPQISSPTYPRNPKRQNSRRIHTRRNVKRNSLYHGFSAAYQSISYQHLFNLFSCFFKDCIHY